MSFSYRLTTAVVLLFSSDHYHFTDVVFVVGPVFGPNCGTDSSLDLDKWTFDFMA